METVSDEVVIDLCAYLILCATLNVACICFSFLGNVGPYKEVANPSALSAQSLTTGRCLISVTFC